MDLSWSNLPQDVTDLILAHLSLAQAARAAAVCRAWQTAITSPSFRRLRNQVQGPRGGPNPASLLLYNHSAKLSAASTWPHPNIMKDTIARRPCTTGSDPDMAAPDRAADTNWVDMSLPCRFVREWVGHARSGLVCIRTHLATSLQQYIVGTPFSAAGSGSNQWSPIPNPPMSPSTSAASLSKLWAIIAGPSSCPNSSHNNPMRFWVILLHLQGGTVSLNIFDSERGAWQMTPVPQSPDESPAGTGLQVLSFSSHADCIGDMIYSIQPKSRAITKFDVRRNEWKRVPCSLPKGLVFQGKMKDRWVETWPRLVEGWRAGSVLLVGGAGHGAGEEICEVGAVWEMRGEAADDDGEGGSNPWYKLARCRLPAEMCETLLAEASDCRMKGGDIMPVRYAGHGDFVLVMASGAAHGVRLDIEREAWTRVELPAGTNCELALCFHPIW